MKRFSFLLAVALVAFVGVPLVNAQPTTTITMGNGSGSPPSGVQGPIVDDVYTSPYYATLGTSASMVPIICDDFADNTYFGEQWTAYITSLSAVTSTSGPSSDTGGPYYADGWSTGTGGNTSNPGGPLEFGGGFNANGTTLLTQEQAYTAAAYLSVEILRQNQNTSAGVTAAEDLSFAQWALFDPAVFADQTNGLGGSCTLEYGCMDATDLGIAEADLNAAVALVTGTTPTLTSTNFDEEANKLLGSDVLSVNILTYDKNGLPLCGGCTVSPQEFIQVTMPEPSTSSLLWVDLLGVAGLVLFARRRWTGAKSS